MNTGITSYKFGGTYEETYGYSQACRAGDTLYISGQVALTEAGEMVGAGDFETQVRTAYKRIDSILHHFGATKEDIVDELIFVVDAIGNYEEMQKLHTGYYGKRHPASTYIGVTALAMSDFMVEIKVTAWLGKR